MELTPNRIYEEYSANILDKTSAVEQLIALIENSSEFKVRLRSINFLGKIEKTFENSDLDKEHLFNLFENLLISDSNEKIRNASALVLKRNFIDQAFSPMKWALHHDDSSYCLKTICESLFEIIKYFEKNMSLSKQFFVDEINQIEDKDFRIGFEILSETKSIQEFTSFELAEILINYFSIVYLKKTNWRLKYSIRDCKVVELDFIFKGLTKLPEALKYLTSLKILALRYNQLTALPEWIGLLSDLECLNLNVNNINALPDSIGSLSSLKNLLLWKNDLQILPDSIGSLSSLNNLNLRLNQLKFLPDEVGNLSKLREINLHDNKLSLIPESICSLPVLENLNLSWNLLKSIPDSIGSLTSLKLLDLERNELVNIPESIGVLSSLEIFNLSDNRLKNIPESIGYLKSLKFLNLSKNELEYLPQSLGSLTSLQELYIGDNNIKYIPKEVEKLEKNGLNIYD